MKLKLFKLLILLAAFSASIVFAEVAVRLLAPQPPSWLNVYRKHPSLPFYAVAPNKHAVVSTGESEWTVHTDSNGFRVSATPEHKANTSTTLVIGDSFTFGQGVNYEETFIGYLNAMDDQPFHYVNGGVGGYGPTQYRSTLQHLLNTGFSPERVVVAVYLGNDFFDCIWNKNLPVVDGILGNQKKFRSLVKQNSHLYRLASKIYHVTAKSETTATTLQLRLTRPNAWKEEDLKKAYAIFKNEFETIATSAKTARSRYWPVSYRRSRPCERPTMNSLTKILTTTFRLSKLLRSFQN